MNTSKKSRLPDVCTPLGEERPPKSPLQKTPFSPVSEDSTLPHEESQFRSPLQTTQPLSTVEDECKCSESSASPASPPVSGTCVKRGHGNPPRMASLN